MSSIEKGGKVFIETPIYSHSKSKPGEKKGIK